MIPLPVNDDKKKQSWDDELVPDKTALHDDLIIPFNDPFEIDPATKSKEIIEMCFALLEKKNPRYLKIFELRLKGIPNREIAPLLNLDITNVQNTWEK